MMRIGIDVGGTNTDAVLLEGRRVVHSVKVHTTPDVTSGVLSALRAVTATAAIERISAVMIGTTHFVNAVIERRGLARVAALRIALPAAAQVKPFEDWPPELRTMTRGPVFLVRGGHEVDGRPIVPLDQKAVRAAARSVRDAGVRAVGITAAFSPVTPACETIAEQIFREEAPEVSVTCSHTLGRIGLLARENVTLLNASLVELARRTVEGFERALRESGITAPLYITQNDGTLVRAEAATRYPVLCFASGPTNSLRGATLLSGLQDALVIDVGGTTSDVGAIQNGFPREANNVIHIGGVRTLFRMPDLISVGIGGGTVINPSDPSQIGPKSVGYRLTSESLVFGGATLTCTDIAVAAGLIDLGDRSRVTRLSAAFVRAALGHIHALGAEAVDRLKSSAAEVPLVVVGGAAFLMPERIAGISRIVHVPQAGFANAVGAAMAQVSGEVDQIFQNLSREEAIAIARGIAAERACEAGADPATLSMIEVEDLPIAYMPGNSLRVRLRMAGSIGGLT
jgi:N-methylhydantoinase A/oxoprolinase/acetone carboxylase beta subunit